jgi:hypothetical protein
MCQKRSVEESPGQQVHSQTGADMRTTSSGFHFLEFHVTTALTTGVSLMLLLGAAAMLYWLMARRARRREAARRQSGQPTYVEVGQLKPGYSAAGQPEVLMDYRGMEQPMAVISGVPRQSALGFMPRVV